MMRIAKHSMTLSKARPMLNRRNCWTYCDDCRSKWSATGTVHVSMKVREVQGVTVTRFLCDECAGGYVQVGDGWGKKEL